MNICGLILAAGGSSRLGQPKQLVNAGGKSLLEHAIENAQKTCLQQIYVVLGAHREQIETRIENLPVTVIRNSKWQEGMGSSISAGIAPVTGEKKWDAVLIMLCDQLHINSQHLQAITSAFRQGKAPLIATAYGNQQGVPALFARQYFTELEKLSGDSGAKKILIRHASHLHTIPFEQALIDIDTPEDLVKNGIN